MSDARLRPRGDRFCRPHRGRACESQARWALSATTLAEFGRYWRPLTWYGRVQYCTVTVYMKPFKGGLRKLYSRLKAVVIHAYYENRDTWGHLRLELL